MLTLLTGTNSGIGLEAGFALAKAGHSLAITCRTQAKADAACQAILQRYPGTPITTYLMDLADLPSVLAAAAQIQAAHPVIDRLIRSEERRVGKEC